MEMKVWITKRWNTCSKKFDLGVQEYAPYESSDRIIVNTQTISYGDMPDAALKAAAVVVLRAKRQTVLADAQVEANKIDAEIQELLALEDLSARKEDDDTPL